MYRYGMRLRGASIGAQPKGFIKFDESDNRYYNVLYYPERLCDEDVWHYSLDYLGECEDEERN